MNTGERRNEIIRIISESAVPVSGSALSEKFGVSRQIIVGDIALLKAQGNDIISTSKGYIISDSAACMRVFKLYHTNEQTEDELTSIVDLGGTVVDVFVWHRVYGKIEAKLNISSRRDVAQCMEGLRTGKSVALLNLTSGYHYHTVKADSEEILDLIGHKLAEKNYIAPEI